MKQIIFIYILMTNFIVVTNAITKNVRKIKTDQSKSVSNEPTSDERLNLCYEKNPILFNLIILITDEDFKNAEKSKARVTEINELYLSQKDTLKDKNTANLINCYRDLINAPDNIKDKESLAYTKLRLKEVEAVISGDQKMNPVVKSASEIPEGQPANQ